MSDRISVRGLTVFGHHGVLDTEQIQGQDFTVDVDLEIDLAPAAESDNVADTVDYGELAEALADVVAGPAVKLIETLASQLADVCLADDRVRAAIVTVHKPHAPIAAAIADVSVTVERRRP